MRALLFHCREYKAEIGRMATRPVGIKHEDFKEKIQDVGDCIVSLTTVEEGDVPENVAAALEKEIKKMCMEVGHINVVLIPFAHLSHSIDNGDDAIKTMDLIESRLKDDNFNVMRAHFGSHKSLLLDIYGHPGNARYREF